MSDKLFKFLEGIEHNRREAIKKLLMGTAFVTPVAVTFGLGGSAKGQIFGQGCPADKVPFASNSFASNTTNLGPLAHNPNCLASNMNTLP
jgi:hypothetical protein